ncbi:MAG: hypothetical protein K0U41_08040, partial [Gammaproteobacteria bacterium]|nr:hypothetical protein [Gammaproteobacteria bacterium]
DGATGETGPRGEMGLPGADSTVPGPQGEKGDTGDTGPQGEQGPIGLTGPQGERGITGSDGATGAQGPAGIQGLRGERGATGPQGTIGSRGPQGVAGGSGPTGPQGLPGNDGAIGPQGPKGDKGDIGATGAASTVPGPQGPAGNDGNDGIDGQPGATGPTGPRGPQGLQGPQGNDGQDSTVPGPRGEEGATGPQGMPGPQGPQGTPGANGTAGQRGLDGLNGARGPQGTISFNDFITELSAPATGTTFNLDNIPITLPLTDGDGPITSAFRTVSIPLSTERDANTPHTLSFTGNITLLHVPTSRSFVTLEVIYSDNVQVIRTMDIVTAGLNSISVPRTILTGIDVSRPIAFRAKRTTFQEPHFDESINRDIVNLTDISLYTDSSPNSALNIAVRSVRTETISPAFRLVGSSGTYSGTGWQQLRLSSSESSNGAFDQGNNISSGVFTAPITGIYHFNVVSNKNGAITSHRVGISTSGSNTPASGGGYYTQSARRNGQWSGTVRLTAGQTVRAVVASSPAGSVEAPEGNSFSGYMVSAS